MLLNKRDSGACRITLRMPPVQQYPRSSAAAAAAPSGKQHAVATAPLPSYTSATLQWLLPGDAGVHLGPAGAERLLASLAAGGSGCGVGEGCTHKGARGGAKLFPGSQGLGSVWGNVTLGGQSMGEEGGLVPARAEKYAVKAKAGVDGVTEWVFTLPGASAALLQAQPVVWR